MPSILKDALKVGILILVLIFPPVFPSHGQSANYIYDNLNRLIRVEYGDGTVIEYTYDAVGNRLEKTVQTSDTIPPIPNPMIWSTSPYAMNSSSISMVATTATDTASPPVSYYFEFVDSPTGGTGGMSSGWQGSTSYTNSGLQPNQQYGYRVKARDSAPTPNETSPSSPTGYIYTLANAPGSASFSNVTQNSIRANWSANGNRPGTEYYCENTTRGTNSGWTTNTYWDSTGLPPGTSDSFRVKARNGDSIETGWTVLESQTTQGEITVTFPNGGESWPIGCSQTIRWTSSGVTGNVKIEISRNGGPSWTTIVASTANDGAHPWTVTNPISTQGQIRVSSVNYPSISDTSDGDFQIGGGSIMITSPNGGDTWPIGCSKTIQWTSAQICGNVKIDPSRNGGSTWTNLVSSTANDGTYNWAVTSPTSGQGRIRVSSVNDPTVLDTSNASFQIGGGSITVISPNGDETWPISCGKTIQWSSAQICGNVKIEVSRNGGSSWAPIISSTPNDGTHPWTVTTPATTQGKIRVSGVNDPGVSDTSNGNFRLGGGTITLTSPNGGDTWQLGIIQTITWTSTQICDNVKIELSRNGGSSWTTLISNTPNDGSYSWTVTGPAIPNARIRVSDVNDLSVSDISDANFTIGGGTIAVNDPNGGETWTIGSSRTIQWTPNWVGGNVEGQLSRNGGSTWTTIFASTPNDGAQNWTVTSPATAQARIRMSNASDSTVVDTSNANFNIQ